MPTWELVLFAAGASMLGTLGGLGGAVILVPALIFGGLSAKEAAPLGLVSVVSASIAAAPLQLKGMNVNHRLGTTVELSASTGAVLGALVAGSLSNSLLVGILIGAATLGALANLRPHAAGRFSPADTSEPLGERIGTLAGVCKTDEGIVSYTPRRLTGGILVTSASGFIAGTTGVSGGFIKTAAATEIMGVPTKVAAATTTFSVAITAASALLVKVLQGNVNATQSAAVIVGALGGGALGALIQHRAPDAMIRKILSGLLLMVAVLLTTKL